MVYRREFLRSHRRCIRIKSCHRIKSTNSAGRTRKRSTATAPSPQRCFFERFVLANRASGRVLVMERRFSFETLFPRFDHGPSMTQPSAGRPMSLRSGAFLAFVAFVIAPSSVVRAECGRDAHSKADRQTGSALAQLDILSTVPREEGAIPNAPPRPPCSGPSCTERPSPPDSPIPPTSPQTDERWLCVSVFADFAALDGSRISWREPSPCPVIRPSTLDRPPRSPRV